MWDIQSLWLWKIYLVFLPCRPFLIVDLLIYIFHWSQTESIRSGLRCAEWFSTSAGGWCFFPSVFFWDLNLDSVSAVARTSQEQYSVLEPLFRPWFLGDLIRWNGAVETAKRDFWGWRCLEKTRCLLPLQSSSLLGANDSLFDPWG